MEDSNPVDVGLAVAANLLALRQFLALWEKKFARLEREKEAAVRKSLQSSRLLEERGRDREGAREEHHANLFFALSKS